MAKSVRNGKLLPNQSDELAVRSSHSSDESSSSTLKSSSESPAKSDTSCKDTNLKESSSDTCKPSNEDDTEIEDLSSISDDQLPRQVTETKRSSSDTFTPSNEVEMEDIPSSILDSKKEDQPESEQAIERPIVRVDSYLSDHNNFADNEDPCNANITKVQAILENLRDIRTPKEVNIGKVVNKRRRRNRSLAACLGGKSPLESLRQSKRLQRGASGAVPHQAGVPSSDSSQDSKVHKKFTGPTKFSSDLFSKSKSMPFTCGQSSEQPSDISIEHSSNEPQDQNLDPSGDSRNIEDSKSVRRKTPGLPPTSKVCLPLSPLPSTSEDESSSQYASSLLLSENLYGNPHASRVNTLTSLLDRVVAFSDVMESISMFSDPDQLPFEASGGEVIPIVESTDHRSLRDLQEDFRNCCEALNSSEVDEDEASASYIESVETLAQKSNAVSDIYYHVHDGSRIPDTDEPVSIEELHYHLPRLWDTLMSNNMILNQWTCTLLDWCLKITPECYPQQFYDTEAGTRNLFRDINYVHRSLTRLMFRWNSRSMYHNELSNLTFLHSLSTTAVTLYAILEAEVVNIRYNLGTRQSTRRRLSNSGDSPEKEQGQIKKAKEG